MKKKFLATFLALVVGFSLQPVLAVSVASFEDVPAGAEYFEDVLYVYNEGIMDGVTPKLFNPGGALTRGVSVNALYRIAGSPDTSNLANPFNDVVEGGLYSDAVKWAAANQVISGYGDSKFGPEDSITRQDFGVMALKCLYLLNTDIVLTQQYIMFDDEADIMDYAKNAAQDIIKLGIIKTTENNAFNPQGNITRADAASIFHKFEGIAVPNQAAPIDTKIKAADSLLSEFVMDEAAATEVYTGQEVVFIGTISETARPKDNAPKTDVCYIVFNNFVDWNESDGVMCYFDSLVVDSVKVGDTVKVKGNFRNYEDNGVFKMLILGECELVQE
ncbi:MAG: S-layer homology domain-containing protein [Clostridiales bacterium]|nr:S-layer homology domain-containing protein [Clostridiales bacterium]